VRYQAEKVFLLTDGLLDLDSDPRYGHWKKLVDCCLGHIAEWPEREFVDRRTLADIMDWGMKRLREKHHHRAPKPWLPVKKELGKGGPALEMVAHLEIRAEQAFGKMK